MNFAYSTEANALYVELQSGAHVARTVEVTPSCLVDLDATGEPVGIELIHPSRSYLDLAKALTTWPLGPEQMAQLLVYPYQSLTPRRRSISSTAAGQVEVAGREPEILTSV